ncbi:MAG TPA: glycerol-3-phosphate 1-O-acyltransferase PlsY [Candidatus Didemnitutus sp.]|nr:glycerol-3-phosphate 1-O-acyltransferase PlsY [Candidatus Didemnitutus sp.]
MIDSAYYVLIGILGYLLGALPFGYLVAKSHGVDIFKVGSGNPGATNVRRVLGSRAGNIVFALDFAKGAVAALVPIVIGLLSATQVTPPDGLPVDQVALFRAETMAHAHLEGLYGLLGALIGHSFSIFTKFKGGKGVATAAGGLVVLIPIACLIGIATWLVTFVVTRFVSLGSILAAIAVPLAAWLINYPLPLRIVATAVGLFVIIRHRVNIQRLLNGTENRFVRKGAAK